MEELPAVEIFAGVSQWRKLLELGTGKTGNVWLCAQPEKNIPDPKGIELYRVYGTTHRHIFLATTLDSYLLIEHTHT